MTNHYRSGRRIELLVAEQLGRSGYDVIVSSVSKGAADMVAFHDGETVFVQVKKSAKTAVSPAERRELLRIARRAGGAALTAHRDRHPENGNRRVTVWRELTGPGPKEWEPWVPRNETTGEDD